MEQLSRIFGLLWVVEIFHNTFTLYLLIQIDIVENSHLVPCAVFVGKLRRWGIALWAFEVFAF